MRTISLLLLVLISLAFAANSRRFKIPQLRNSEPQLDQHKLMYLPQLNILIAINEAVHRGVGLRIHTNYTYPTEVVISKCGVPILLIFEARTATGIISNEEVEALHNVICEENDEKNWISLTTKSDPYIEGNTLFTAGVENEDFGPVKIHNISSPVIAKVDFSLPGYDMNMWPIKIGRLLREAAEPNTQLILSINAINKFHFTFWKCGQLVEGIPWATKPFILNATQIDAFQVVYNLKCGKPWMDEIIELIIYTDNMPSMGTLEFKLVKEQMEKQEEKLPSMEITTIRIVLFALFFIICCAAIMIVIHTIVVCLPTYW